MKKIVLPLVLSAIALGTVGAAQAQSLNPVQHPFTIKLGIHVSSDGTATDDQGGIVFAAGADYALGKSSSANPILPSVYLDYFGGSRNGGSENTYGLGIAARAYGSQPSGNNAGGALFYGGGGVGIYNTSDKANKGAGPAAGSSDNNTSIGGKLFAGVEFSGNYLAELNYTFVPSVNGANPSGFGLQVGYRF